MQILVTGVNSHIAIDICNYFIKKKHTVFGVYNLKKNNLKNLSNRCKLIKTNLLKLRLDNFPKNIDMIIHLAANTNYKNKNIFNINYKASKKIFDYAKKSNCKKFIFFSTTSIQYEKNNKEKNKYILSKKKSENYFKNKGIKVISLRLPSILSPELNKSLWFSKLHNKIFTNQEIKVYNSDLFTNHFIYYEDITKFIGKISYLKKLKNYDEINLCSTGKIKIIEIVNMIKKKYKSNSKIKFIFSDAKNTLINNKKLLNKYFFKPLSVKRSISNFLYN